MRRHLLLLVALASALLVAPAGAGEPDRVLSTSEALLASPTTPAPSVTLGPDERCGHLISRARGAACGVVHLTEGPAMLYTIEPGDRIDDVLATRPWTVRVYGPDPAAPGALALALSTVPDGELPGPLFAEVTGVVADVSGDGRDDLVVGYRSEGTGHFLDVDVISSGADGAPTVLGHDRLVKGTVLVRPGRLVTFSPEYRRRDANCCPTWIRRSVVHFVDGRLVVDEGPRRPTRDVEVPPGDVG